MKKISVLPLALIAFLLPVSFAIAAESGEHSLPWGNFALRTVNLVLFAGLMYYFFGKKISAFFKNRTEGISSEISSLEERKQKAQESLKAVEERIQTLDAERTAIMDSYKQQGELLKISIIKEAEKNANQITEQAKITAQNEILQAVEYLRKQVAEEIALAAEKTIIERMTPAEQENLINKSLTRVVLN